MERNEDFNFKQIPGESLDENRPKAQGKAIN